MSFTVLILFIVLIVNSMQALIPEAAEEIHEEAVIANDEREALLLQIVELARESGASETR
ncbi:MAG: hypothetical protein P8M18_11995 [Woeseiaceae bacterium]|nr:hypothetical protein [Woeseiaceae bacterium]